MAHEPGLAVLANQVTDTAHGASDYALQHKHRSCSQLSG